MCYLCDKIAPICRWHATKALRSIEDIMLQLPDASSDSSDDLSSPCGSCGEDSDQEEGPPEGAKEADPPEPPQRKTTLRQGTNRPRTVPHSVLAL